jgi:DNA-binding CsgD family transcriptional regulator
VPNLNIAEEKGLADPLLWALTRRSDIYLDESERIARLARELIEAKMSPRKRQVVMLLATNHSQAGVARILNISRQAISKMWNSPAIREFLRKYPEFASPQLT